MGEAWASGACCAPIESSRGSDASTEVSAEGQGCPELTQRHRPTDRDSRARGAGWTQPWECHPPREVSRGHNWVKESDAERQEREDPKRHRAARPERHKAIHRASGHTGPSLTSKFTAVNCSGRQSYFPYSRKHIRIQERLLSAENMMPHPHAKTTAKTSILYPRRQR